MTGGTLNGGGEGSFRTFTPVPLSVIQMLGRENIIFLCHLRTRKGSFSRTSVSGGVKS